MKYPIKVTFVINNLANGGAEKVLVNIVNNLDYSKIKPTIFLFEKEGNYLLDVNKEVDIRYAFEETKVTGYFTKIQKIFRRILFGVKKLSDSIDDQDLVIAFLERGVTYLTYQACRRKQKKCYSWIHTNLDDRLGKFHGILSQYFYKKIQKVICVSQECEDLAIKRIPCLKYKIKTIYNPIDINKIIELGNQEDNTFKMPKGINIIGIGRLSYEKAFDNLIKAFAKVSKERENVNLILLGEGSERKNLEQLKIELGIDDKVYMPGFVNNPYVFLKKSDLFVLSSRYEGLSTVLIESLALNKNIISTKCSGAQEILGNGQYGKLVEIDDIDELYNAIIQALDDTTSKNGIKQAYKFDKDQIIKEIERIILNS